MCGRYSMTVDERRLADRFGARFVSGHFEPTYNAAPSQLLPIITNENPDEITLARWGFVPEWAGPSWSLKPQINARVEGIEDKRTFSQAWRGRHCLVIADGYYEWKRMDDRRQPFRFVMADREPFAMAGIWARGEDGEPVTFAILTTAANEVAAAVHDRMPVILPRKGERSWLPPTPSSTTFFPAPGPLTAYRVSTKMNNPRFNEPAVVAPI